MSLEILLDYLVDGYGVGLDGPQQVVQEQVWCRERRSRHKYMRLLAVGYPIGSL